jgi:uncharacterized protein YoxC
MNQVWIWLITVAILVTAGFLVALLIELRKMTRSLTEFLKTTGEPTKTTLEELQQTLKSLRTLSDDIENVTDDIKKFSGAVKDVGQNIGHINTLIENITSSALIEASSLKVGIKTALGILSSNLLNNLFKKGGKQ